MTPGVGFAVEKTKKSAFFGIFLDMPLALNKISIETLASGDGNLRGTRVFFRAICRDKRFVKSQKRMPDRVIRQ